MVQAWGTYASHVLGSLVRCLLLSLENAFILQWPFRPDPRGFARARCSSLLAVRTWRDARAKGIFVGWQGTRCFNLVAEPRWFLALAILLIAVVAGCWFGDVLQEATFAKNTLLQYGFFRHMKLCMVEHHVF